MNELSPEGGEFPSASERVRFVVYSQVFRTTRHLITAAMFVCLGYFAFRSIAALSGEITLVTASLSVLKSSHGVPWALALLMFVWAVAERKLRRSKTRYLSDRIQKLERHIDPDRTSSGLLPSGQSNPKDK